MKVIVVAGPTGVGKSKVAINLARQLDGEIINADSRQVYRGMAIATAKEIVADVPHHLFDIKEWDEAYSAFDYQQDCRAKIAEITARGKWPILVGGTGLYIKAALYDYQFMAARKNSYQQFSNEALYQKLKAVDPATDIPPNNRKRIEQALNYYEQTGERYSQKAKTTKLLYDVTWIGLTMPREKLYQRINQRVDKMIAEGLVDEAYEIYRQGAINKIVLTPIGYKELFAYFDKKQSWDETVASIKQQTRNYAKRQYTWFNNQLPLNWFLVEEDLHQTTQKILRNLALKKNL